MTVTITSNGGGSTAAISMEEGGTAVTTVVATRPALTFSKSGTDAAAFTLNTSTGELTMASAPDYETPTDANTDNDYVVDVTVTDPVNSATDTQTITARVTNTSEVTATGDFFGGPGTIELLSNTQITVGHSSNGEKIAIGIRYPGSQITSLRVKHQMNPGDNRGPAGYHQGDGGVVKYSIQADVGGVPSGVKLGTTGPIVAAPVLFNDSQSAAAARYPGAIWTEYGESGIQLRHFRRINLLSPVTVSPNAKYWIVMENTTLNGYTTPDWSNTISHNQVRNRDQWIRPMLDSSFDDTHEYRVLRYYSGAWLDRSAGPQGTISIFEVFGNGPGYGYAGYGLPSTPDSEDSTYAYRLNGTKKIREKWTPADARTIKKFAVAGAYESGSAAMTVKIQQGGSTLYTGSLTGFPTTSNSASIATLYDEMESKILTVPDIAVSAGVPVYFEMSTTAGTNLLIAACKDAQGSYFTNGGTPTTNGEVFNGSTWATGKTYLEIGCGWTAT